MSAKLQMVTRTVFGFSNKAQLNRALVDAIEGSMGGCEDCGQIHQEIQTRPEGGDFVEAASFPGRTVQRLDAHFKYHWKDEYELVDLAHRKALN